MRHTRTLTVHSGLHRRLQAFKQLEAELNREEAVKQQLCDELNHVITTSVSSQLEHFEQLRVKLEALYGGAGAAAASAPSSPTQQLASTPTTAGQAEPGAGANTAAGANVTATQPVAHHQQQPAGSHPQHVQQQLTLSSTAAPEDAAAAKAAAAVAALGAAATAAAEAARSRHVQLPGRLRNPASGGGHEGGARQHPQPHAKGQQQTAHSSQVARDRDGRFAGFDP